MYLCMMYMRKPHSDIANKQVYKRLNGGGCKGSYSEKYFSGAPFFSCCVLSLVSRKKEKKEEKRDERRAVCAAPKLIVQKRGE